MEDKYIIGMFICLAIGVIINYYNINKHIKEVMRQENEKRV